MIFARRSSVTLDGIAIRGGSEFIKRTKESLTLLGSVPEFALIRDSIAVIRQARRSGMKAWLPKPTFNVGKPTWSHSVVWYAGAIAHDAYHAKLYGDAMKHRRGNKRHAESWTGAAAEKKCLEFQRRVLRQLDADEMLIAYVEKCRENPTYQGRNKGWGSRLDYLKRWW